jgi:Uma2 family endonuclease
MTTATTRLTLKRFLDIPEQKPALELTPEGTIHEKMSPNTDHSALQLQIGRLLLNWIDADPERRARTRPLRDLRGPGALS